MVIASSIDEDRSRTTIVPERMRKTDDEDRMRAFADSVRTLAQLVPIKLVRRGNKSVPVAGRRLEAAKLTGKDGESVLLPRRVGCRSAALYM